MDTIKDAYPSRVEGVAEILPRTGPVVHGDGGGPLSQTQLDTFDKKGFLFCEGFFGDETVKRMQEELDRLRMSERVRQSEIAVTEPMSGETRSIFGVHSVSKLFADIAAEKSLLAIVEQLMGSKVYLHQSRVNFKPGFRGKEFYWHSDFETWHTEDGMPAMRAVSCSIALTQNNEYNGPLMLMPGSHKHYVQCTGATPDHHYKTSLKKQDFGVPSDEHLTWLAEQYGIEVPKGAPGSLVLFDCNVMHGSNGNITPYPRSNAFFVYNSIENTLDSPFGAREERPWYLANREPEALAPVEVGQDTDDSPQKMH